MRGIRRRLATDESGFSLVELLVAIILMGIVLTMIANIYISTVKATDQAGSRHASTGNASNVANELNAVIRFATTNPVAGATDPAPALLAGTTTRVVLMSTIGAPPTVEAGGRPTKPTLVEFQRTSAGQMQERRWNPTASGTTWVFAGTDPTATTPASTQLLGGTMPAGTVFRYFKADDGVDTTNEEIVPAVGGLTSAQLPLVASIEVRISMVPPNKPTATPVVIVNRIALANLGLRETS
ncbi:type IV pilus modification PilV family protein [Agromyces allii]|uniref:Prepilin-type N-terminal cleavage/methylation domain-containing protein n=1 Tax=Agromyces allii TaxID=393607 RepID=A0ABP5BF10_9MICO|nr:prepilin-type N-terminal cleavage/methylation domain-containing protein [Agromyces allii]